VECNKKESDKVNEYLVSRNSEKAILTIEGEEYAMNTDYSFGMNRLIERKSMDLEKGDSVWKTLNSNLVNNRLNLPNSVVLAYYTTYLKNGLKRRQGKIGIEELQIDALVRFRD
jgi:hypothetical protein